ncbi:uncharacterized protein CC84DRAFT_62256 [Paraphaeosphaeria sporulosa]|uniref:Uncharacterized protein n=1 Tax=Paraphaeosphaeria sporulosa TaxID=1460663 RepID=A0A177CYF3_9PLEO|nr:uncharacterized protein CC84DRAFT_62256 [Paraphaeosphaeria sporulosa]OAG11942.1 hypothetical protein CC84DRAFT_62256 [Paraphaeosphaeria sporulosa]
MTELPQFVRNSHCSPSRCITGTPGTHLRPSRGMSANPRQPYTHLLHRAMSLFGRTPLLQVGVVPDLWRPRRLPMLFSNSLPQSGSSAPASHMSILPVVTLGSFQPASHYIRRYPRTTFVLTLASSLFRNHALFLPFILFYLERAPYRAGSEGDIVLRTLF